jgi:hypothetical protein
VSVRFRGVLFEKLGQFGSRVERAFDVPWTDSAIGEVFGEQDPETKDQQQLWAAATYQEGANRGNAGIITNTAAVLDCDCADPGALDDVLAWIKPYRLAHMVYSSWSHGLREKQHGDSGRSGPFDCFRVVLPYARDCTPAEHVAVVAGLFGHELPNDPDHYIREVAGRTVTMPSGRERAARPRGWDPSSGQPTRGFYVPTVRSLVEVYPGDALDPDLVLRRPTTARPSLRGPRTYSTPDVTAVGALGEFDRALRKHGFGFGRAGGAGWARSTCPSCQDPSPSLTARANGSGLELRCHALCSRRDILSAVGLSDDGLFAAPSEIQDRLQDQLASARPQAEAVGVERAVELLVEDIREAVASNEPNVIIYPAGTGKSFASAKIITESADAGEKVIYSTQEHRVAAQTLKLLPAHVRARTVHIHSPLLQVGDDPACQRAEELSERVFDFGLSLLGSVCPKCPFRDSCGALEAARDRAARLPDAQVVFVSHAGIRQAIKPDTVGIKLIVDEMPGSFEELSLGAKELASAATAPLAAAELVSAAAAREIARAWAACEAPGDVRVGGRALGPALDVAAAEGRLRLRERARISPAERKALHAADVVMRLAAYQMAGNKVCGLSDPAREGVWAMIPDPCQQALIDHGGTLLSATPLMPALPGFRVRECQVTDGARVRRVMVLRGGRGSGALTRNYYDDIIGARAIRERDPGELPGVPWFVVDEAINRALAEADRYGPDERVLFCTFKSIADLLRARTDDPRMARVRVAHFGALRGKNDWMEGQPDECSVVYCLGAPRFALKPTLVALGLHGEAADQAWVQYAAGELAQAEGRLRLPRRTKPCSVMIEGDVAPSTWYPDIVDEVQLRDLDDVSATSSRVEATLFYMDLPTLDLKGAKELITVGRPTQLDEEILQQLYPMPSRDGMGWIAEFTPARRAQWLKGFSWTPSG